jgi:cadmium resistance protein CadD (predicted permease)
MPEHLLFAISAALVTVSTNLDNLAVLLGLIVVVSARRAVMGFVIAQLGILIVSLAIASGLSQTGILSWIGYLGVIPLILGLRGLWRQFTQHEETDTQDRSHVSSIVVLFLSLSIDTLAAMTPLLADSTATFRIAAVIGAVVAVLGVSTIAILGAPRAQSLAPRFARLDRITPYVMVSVGLYILLNTPTDVL